MFTSILSSDFVSFTSTTIFEFSLLKNFDSHLIYNHASFKGYSNSYNHFFGVFQSIICYFEIEMKVQGSQDLFSS